MKLILPVIQVSFMIIFAGLASKARADDNSDIISINLAAETVAWQLHWEKIMGLCSNSPATVNLQMHQESAEVLVNDLKWVVSYGYGGNQEYPIHVDRLIENREELPSEMARFEHLTRDTVNVPNYANKFKKISFQSSPLRQKLLASFASETCNQDGLSLYIDEAGKRIQNPRFWIAPVDPTFPVIMYIVEGVPYIGKVYFNTHSLKPVYSEFNYISDDPQWRQACLKLMKAMHSEGDLFVLENGRLKKSP